MNVQGNKTNIGIILTIMGNLGIIDMLGISSDQAASLVDATFTIVGILITIYGNYDAHKRLKEQSK